MKTQNPDVLTHMFWRQMTNQKTPVAAFNGVLDATILDTDTTNPTINPTGMCRVIVPQYATNIALGPVAYPGEIAPPNTTPCTVGFVNPQINTSTAVQVRVLALLGWSPTDSDIFAFFLAG